MQTGRGVPPVFQPARVGSTDAGLCEALSGRSAAQPAQRVSWPQALSGHFRGRWGGASVLAKKENVITRQAGDWYMALTVTLLQGPRLTPDADQGAKQFSIQRLGVAAARQLSGHRGHPLSLRHQRPVARRD